MLCAVTNGAVESTPIPSLGINPAELLCFSLFWVMQASLMAGVGYDQETGAHTACPELMEVGRHIKLARWQFRLGGRLC